MVFCLILRVLQRKFNCEITIEQSNFENMYSQSWHSVEKRRVVQNPRRVAARRTADGVRVF